MSVMFDFDYFSLALDESCGVRDTAQLLVFLRGITADFKNHGGAGSHAVSERDREWFLHKVKCMFGEAGTEMGQTDRCDNRWLTKSDS